MFPAPITFRQWGMDDGALGGAVHWAGLMPEVDEPNASANADAGNAYRAVFISDVHLGCRFSRAEELFEFLGRIEPDRLYLVGDMIDGKRLKRSWFWNPTNSMIIQHIVHLAGRGPVVYVAGNHDHFLRDYTGRKLAGVEILREALHTTANGKKLLVVHGDEYEQHHDKHHPAALLGKMVYHGTSLANVWLNALRARLGLRYRSLSLFLKDHSRSRLLDFRTSESISRSG